MNELEEAWSQMLEGALAEARASGREQVAEFLRLKQSNDMIRQTSVNWLFAAFIEAASHANRQNSAITIEREEPHEFKLGNATMSGNLLRIRFGVRNITVEAGWTRLPSHGVMRNGALAAAQIKHFGIPKSDVELMLRREAETPVWKNVADGDDFNSESVRWHLGVLLGV